MTDGKGREGKCYVNEDKKRRVRVRVKGRKRRREGAKRVIRQGDKAFVASASPTSATL